MLIYTCFHNTHSQHSHIHQLLSRIHKLTHHRNTDLLTNQFPSLTHYYSHFTRNLEKIEKLATVQARKNLRRQQILDVKSAIEVKLESIERQRKTILEDHRLAQVILSSYTISCASLYPYR